MEQYLFGSARIHVLENGLIGKERLERLLNAGSLERAVDILAEFGVEILRDKETGAFLREATLQKRLQTAFAEVDAATEGAEFLKIWLCPYDCNNLKAVIKCRARGVDPSEMLFNLGSLDANALILMAQKHDFSALPAPFGEAAGEASAVFAQTGNPQWVDLILDRACFEAMKRGAEATKNDFVISLVCKQIDLINLMTCIRLLRMKSGEAGKALLRDAFIPGGKLGADLIEGYYAGGEFLMWQALAATDYAAFANAVNENSTLTEIERAADNDRMESLRTAILIPYGIEPLTAYLVGAEYEVRNLRILLAGLEAGLKPKTIGERIRKSYV